MCHICLLRSFLDWLFFGFDDTDWPNATEYQMNEDRFREIDPSASFIFVADDHSSGYHYCRKNIGLISHNTYTHYIRVPSDHMLSTILMIPLHQNGSKLAKIDNNIACITRDSLFYRDECEMKNTRVYPINFALSWFPSSYSS